MGSTATRWVWLWEEEDGGGEKEGHLQNVDAGANKDKDQVLTWTSLQPSSLHHRELRPLSRSPRRLPRCQHFQEPYSYRHHGCVWAHNYSTSRSPGRKSMSVPSSPRLRAWYTILSISLFSLRFSPTSSGLCSGIQDSSCNAQSNSPKPVSPLIPLILALRNTLWWKRLPTEHCQLLTNGKFLNACLGTLKTTYDKKLSVWLGDHIVGQKHLIFIREGFK